MQQGVNCSRVWCCGVLRVVHHSMVCLVTCATCMACHPHSGRRCLQYGTLTSDSLTLSSTYCICTACYLTAQQTAVDPCELLARIARNSKHQQHHEHAQSQTPTVAVAAAAACTKLRSKVSQRRHIRLPCQLALKHPHTTPHARQIAWHTTGSSKIGSNIPVHKGTARSWGRTQTDLYPGTHKPAGAGCTTGMGRLVQELVLCTSPLATTSSGQQSKTNTRANAPKAGPRYNACGLQPKCPAYTAVQQVYLHNWQIRHTHTHSTLCFFAATPHVITPTTQMLTHHTCPLTHGFTSC